MNITAILLHLAPGAKFCCRNNDPDQIDWHPDNTAPKPARAEIESAWPAVQVALADADRDRAAREKLASIDAASVRAIREYLAKLPDAPKALKEHESEAVAERAKLIPARGRGS